MSYEYFQRRLLNLGYSEQDEARTNMFWSINQMQEMSTSLKE